LCQSALSGHSERRLRPVAATQPAFSGANFARVFLVCEFTMRGSP